MQVSVAKLLAVTPDADDNRAYDAGYPAALTRATRGQSEVVDISVRPNEGYVAQMPRHSW
ncbi:hypothetical protein [Gordonia oryzae]|uniref:hypothetical protein n=1 Tax=Gordonia oryzae TaxID=2487349 RepID=UPI001616DCB5|nr:hypothetical protein [Gordonia oryzae]